MSNASDYLIQRDPWLPKLGSRNPGEKIDVSCKECFPKILRGRPTYDRLPGAAQAYNKEANDYLIRGTIIIPEAPTVVTSAEDLFFRERFPEEYTSRDYVSGSYFGPGSGAVLVSDNLQPLTVGTNIRDLELIVRSATIFWGESRIRDASNISKDTKDFSGLVLTLPSNFSGWLYINGAGTLEISEQLPDGILNLTENIWCNSNSESKTCAKRVRSFADESLYIDKLDVGETDAAINNGTNLLEPLLYEVSPLYKFSTSNSVLTSWEDYRRFNREFNAPIAKWLTDHADNFLMDKKEQTDTFFDDYLYPDSVGLFLLLCDGPIRSSYKPENVAKIVDSWDFGLINEESLRGPFSFLTNAEIDDLLNYDFYTNKILDWLAQHFGFIDNGDQYEIWHNGSSYNNTSNNVTYTIAEKRAILRNAYTSDTFQEYDYDNKEFYFTRFPFSLYNRLKPSNWEGLLKARGTERALEFMFDVMGLYGYKSYTLQPRYNDSLLDFDEPLSLIKYSNKPVVGYIKELDINGTIIDRTDLSLNDINYAETGIFKIGETEFAEGHDRLYTLRLPFSWDRNGKNWNRVNEIINTYAAIDSINMSYYYYVIGKSAAGECIFNRENTYTTEYLISEEYVPIPYSHLFTSAINLYFNYNNSYDKYVKNVSLDNVYPQSNIPVLNSNNAIKYKYIDPIYIGNDTIIFAAQIIFSNVTFTEAVPLLVSTDNGLTFNHINSIIIGKPSTYKVKTIHKMVSFNDVIYVIGRDLDSNDKMFTSLDKGLSFTEYSLPNNDGTSPLDVFYDEEAKITYLAMGTKVYYKYSNNGTWQILLDSYHLEDYEAIENISIIKTLSGIYIVMSIRLPTPNYDVELRVLYTANKGVNKFLLYKENTFPYDDGSSQLRVQVAPEYLFNNGTDTLEFVILHGASTYLASRITTRSFDGEEFIDRSNELINKLQEIILEYDKDLISTFNTAHTNNNLTLTLNYESIIWKEEYIFDMCIFSDVVFNYETNKFDVLVTLMRKRSLNKLFIKESIIVSFSKSDFSDLAVIKRNIPTHLDTTSRTDGLNRATSMPKYLLPYKKRAENISAIIN